MTSHAKTSTQSQSISTAKIPNSIKNQKGRNLYFLKSDDTGGKLPLIIQFVDSEENVSRVLPILREMTPDRLITIQHVDILP